MVSFAKELKSQWLPILFEVCFCTSVLVTLVVHFVLIPVAKRQDPYRYSRLTAWRAMTLHYANVLMIFTEAFFSQLEVHLEHWVFVLAFCNLYLVFAWAWYYKTGVYYYFFLNYNRFRWAPLAYVGLVALLATVWVSCKLLVDFHKAYTN
mmetsp:Transcript_9289/g.20212  ORF Transcript_9289/g.20212 Transcript_9289/m.20212 type:complete len:150 (-) Transcript_9289:352-801(-)